MLVTILKMFSRPGDIVSFFDLGEQEERSFLSVVRHTVLEGPINLVWFSDSAKGFAGAYGKYWMYGSEVGSTSDKSREKAHREISRRWAVSDDLGDLELTWVMHLPEGASVSAYWGFAKFQPKISSEGQTKLRKQTKKSYEGGSIQLVLQVNEEQKKWISGPYRTLGLRPTRITRRVPSPRPA
jgi:hypothetical protein